MHCCVNDKNELINIAIENRARLIQLATKILNCRYLAEDVVQEMILRLCETAHCEDIQNPLGYLSRMVRNMSIDWVRHRVSEERHYIVLEEEVENTQAYGSCPETVAEQCQALRRIPSALNELPERTRYVFEMHRINGVSQKEIAVQMGISTTLVNFIVRAAHEHCRARLMR